MDIASNDLAGITRFSDPAALTPGPLLKHADVATIVRVSVLRFDMIRRAFDRNQVAQLRDQIDRHGWR